MTKYDRINNITFIPHNPHRMKSFGRHIGEVMIAATLGQATPAIAHEKPALDPETIVSLEQSLPADYLFRFSKKNEVRITPLQGGEILANFTDLANPLAEPLRKILLAGAIADSFESGTPENIIFHIDTIREYDSEQAERWYTQAWGAFQKRPETVVSFLSFYHHTPEADAMFDLALSNLLTRPTEKTDVEQSTRAQVETARKKRLEAGTAYQIDLEQLITEHNVHDFLELAAALPGITGNDSPADRPDSGEAIYDYGRLCDALYDAYKFQKIHPETLLRLANRTVTTYPELAFEFFERYVGVYGPPPDFLFQSANNFLTLAEQSDEPSEQEMAGNMILDRAPLFAAFLPKINAERILLRAKKLMLSALSSRQPEQVPTQQLPVPFRPTPTKLWPPEPNWQPAQDTKKRVV